MYNGMQKIESVIDYIEENITSPLDCEKMASDMSLSVYEFRRIFSFIVGSPVSEYIRKRRLTLAACEIIDTDKPDMLAISEKYGYSSQSAFTKAFRDRHGVSPTACAKGNCSLKLFSRPKFDFSVSGAEDNEVRMIKSAAFYVAGYGAVSPFTDTCCCESVWSGFYESGTDKKLEKLGLSSEIYVAYKNVKSDVECTIGARSQTLIGGLSAVRIPAGGWACFKLDTVEDDAVNAKYGDILYKWLPSANLKKRDDLPIVEVYPFDMTKEGFSWEIRIPVGK